MPGLSKHARRWFLWSGRDFSGAGHYTGYGCVETALCVLSPRLWQINPLVVRARACVRTCASRSSFLSLSQVITCGSCGKGFHTFCVGEKRIPYTLSPPEQRDLHDTFVAETFGASWQCPKCQTQAAQASPSRMGNDSYAPPPCLDFDSSSTRPPGISITLSREVSGDSVVDVSPGRVAAFSVAPLTATQSAPLYKKLSAMAPPEGEETATSADEMGSEEAVEGEGGVGGLDEQVDAKADGCRVGAEVEVFGEAETRLRHVEEGEEEAQQPEDELVPEVTTKVEDEAQIYCSAAVMEDGSGLTTGSVGAGVLKAVLEVPEEPDTPEAALAGHEDSTEDRRGGVRGEGLLGVGVEGLPDEGDAEECGTKETPEGDDQGLNDALQRGVVASEAERLPTTAADDGVAEKGPVFVVDDVVDVVVDGVVDGDDDESVEASSEETRRVDEEAAARAPVPAVDEEPVGPTEDVEPATSVAATSDSHDVLVPGDGVPLAKGPEEAAAGDVDVETEDEVPAARQGSEPDRCAAGSEEEAEGIVANDATSAANVDSDDGGMATSPVVCVSPSSAPRPLFLRLSPTMSAPRGSATIAEENVDPDNAGSIIASPAPGVSPSSAPPPLRLPRSSAVSASLVRRADDEEQEEAAGRSDTSSPSGRRLPFVTLFSAADEEEENTNQQQQQQEQQQQPEEPERGALLLDFPRSPASSTGGPASRRPPSPKSGFASLSPKNNFASTSPKNSFASLSPKIGFAATSARADPGVQRSPHRPPLGPVATRQVLETSKGPIWSPPASPRRKSVAGTGQKTPALSSRRPPRRSSRSPPSASSSSAANAAATGAATDRSPPPSTTSRPRVKRGREGRSALRDSSSSRAAFRRSASSSVVFSRVWASPQEVSDGDGETAGGGSASGGAGGRDGGRRSSAGSARSIGSDARDEDASGGGGTGTGGKLGGTGKAKLRRVESLNNLKEEGEEYGLSGKGERSSSIAHDERDDLGMDLAEIVTHLKEVRGEVCCVSGVGNEGSWRMFCLAVMQTCGGAFTVACVMRDVWYFVVCCAVALSGSVVSVGEMKTGYFFGRRIGFPSGAASFGGCSRRRGYIRMRYPLFGLGRRTVLMTLWARCQMYCVKLQAIGRCPY